MDLITKSIKIYKNILKVMNTCWQNDIFQPLNRVILIKISSLNHRSEVHTYCQDIEMKGFSILFNHRKFGLYTWQVGFSLQEVTFYHC